MNNLLDTHTLIWFINGDNDLSNKAKIEIEVNAPDNYVSIASVWEIAIKISVGKLKLKTSFEDFINKIGINSFQILPISPFDALTVSTLPFYHRDPFDRIIIAQAKNNNLQVITKDTIFAHYDVSIFW
jgi:PIN domain nuclease of toxin-antitoxin system